MKSLEQFALPFVREVRISLVKMLFATRQNLQTNSKDALVILAAGVLLGGRRFLRHHSLGVPA